MSSTSAAWESLHTTRRHLKHTPRHLLTVYMDQPNMKTIISRAGKLYKNLKTLKGDSSIGTTSAQQLSHSLAALLQVQCLNSLSSELDQLSLSLSLSLVSAKGRVEKEEDRRTVGGLEDLLPFREFAQLELHFWRDSIVDTQGEYKVSGNLLSFGSTVKLDGSNYEIWRRVFMMSVKGHRKKHVIEEEEPLNKTGKYSTWEEDNNIVMSWIMNSVQAHITPTIAYYTSAKHMWEFLKQSYSHDKNMSKVLQVEEELLKLQQCDSDLAQYFASVKSTYERLKALRPPCQSCYKTHFEQHMVAKFLAGLSPDFAVAKAQMLTGAEIPDLAEAYNRLSRLAVTLSPSSTDAPSSALAAPGGRGQSLAISGSRGQTFNRGRGGRSSGGGHGRFQCTFCGRLGHLEDRCWNKHGRPMIRGSESSQIKNSSHIPKASHVEDDHTESNVENVTVSMSKSEYEQFLAQKASSSSLASTVVGDSTLSTTMQNRDPGGMRTAKPEQRSGHVDNFLGW
ncbi:hypothetical protein EJ110_NYTH32764 [Nymphaea thermarum]|nr:hypothetical protein EJ110_NYTH32764 [Nymphaea thermarum]